MLIILYNIKLKVFIKENYCISHFEFYHNFIEMVIEILYNKTNI